MNTSKITGPGRRPENLLVQKSQPLIALWQSDFTLPEFKILDTYISRIDSHHPEKRTVYIDKGDLEKLLGVKKINTSELRKRVRHLMGQVVELSQTDDEIDAVVLFERAVCKKDEYGVWQVQLECTQSAMKYFFNVDNLGYLRYKLRCVTNISSRYSYLLFIYLETNRFRRKWTVDLQELKEILGCANEESYKQFKYVNDKILKKCQKELQEKTECRFSYTPIKKGRTVIAIQFVLQVLRDIDDLNRQYELPMQDGNDTITFLQSACTMDGTPEFSKSHMEELLAILITIPEDKLPIIDRTDDIDIRRYHYLREKYTRMNRVSTSKKISNRFTYLAAMVRADKED